MLGDDAPSARRRDEAKGKSSTRRGLRRITGDCRVDRAAGGVGEDAIAVDDAERDDPERAVAHRRVVTHRVHARSLHAADGAEDMHVGAAEPVAETSIPNAGSKLQRSHRREIDHPRDVLSRAMKTNAARILDGLGIRYELREYAVDPDDLAAETVAAKIGLPAEQVFKTLVARGDKKGICLAVVPGDAALDLKALAKLTGDARVETVALKEVQPLTGYVRGGVTALACKKEYPVFVDETAELFDVISISAGQRGTQILIAPSDYVRAIRGTIGAIARAK
jgi:Cys-tRNA(Pro)/Cys-tRNA(Cys) deacylase